MSHSKVETVEHNALRIQKYLQANQTQMNKEEAQLIFKMRCRVTEVKNNMKGSYENLECTACGLEEENQKHILECKILNINGKYEEVKYEKLFNGRVSEKLIIARKFKENFDMLENMKK